jgi:hypothetical protein
MVKRRLGSFLGPLPSESSIIRYPLYSLFTLHCSLLPPLTIRDLRFTINGTGWKAKKVRNYVAFHFRINLFHNLWFNSTSFHRLEKDSVILESTDI